MIELLQPLESTPLSWALGGTQIDDHRNEVTAGWRTQWYSLLRLILADVRFGRFAEGILR
jgi:hypothetical protein